MLCHVCVRIYTSKKRVNISRLAFLLSKGGFLNTYSALFSSLLQPPRFSLAFLSGLGKAVNVGIGDSVALCVNVGALAGVCWEMLVI